ncbi:hypothetical protein [Photobacterium halotolerans]|uniref:hypothetical protein n=1 Tax=Photobacterium halotolerans TaxID=265726 RepID=UPI003B21E0AA
MYWIKAFINFHDKRHPETMGKKEHAYAWRVTSAFSESRSSNVLAHEFDRSQRSQV